VSNTAFALFCVQIAVLLSAATLFGQLMRRIRQPAILGEMLAGILIGPTLLGTVFPGLYTILFESSDTILLARDAAIKLGMLFFLFIAGLEIDLHEVLRLGRKTVMIGLVGTLLPIGLGMGLVYLIPAGFWGAAVQKHLFSFALFVGMNFANSANPVIARILLDLGLLRGEVGTLIMGATIFDDLINWTLFAIVMSDIAPQEAGLSLPGGVGVSILWVVVLFVILIGGGRLFGTKSLYWARTKLTWPSGFIALTAVVILLAASLSEFLGVHAFLGAFLVGVSLGGPGKEQDEAHQAINHFVSSFFTPIYFISIGMSANFFVHFDGRLIALILAAALFTKLSAVMLGAKLSGMQADRSTWAIAFGLNARGATGMILAQVGLVNGLIDERLFVAFAAMVLVTTLMSAPVMNYLLKGAAIKTDGALPAAAENLPVEH
jgi:Kef-type K+ transport system membrane component KefB